LSKRIARLQTLLLSSRLAGRDPAALAGS